MREGNCPVRISLIIYAAKSAGRRRSLSESAMAQEAPSYLTPPILPANPTLYAVLRKTHTILAYLLFVTFLAHLGAVLFHTLIVRDGLLKRMVIWPFGSRKTRVETDQA